MNESGKEIIPAVIAAPFDPQQHLDQAGAAYLTGISGADSRSYHAMEKKLALLPKHLKEPRNILSVGIGGGEEMEALSRLFPSTTQYLGIDLSTVALSVVRDRLKQPMLALGNAMHLPFKGNSLDGVIYSALLHEVFSYTPQGVEGWSRAVAEGMRVLAPGGYMLIRDPAAPQHKSPVRVAFKTEFARSFYDYFSSCYRVDNGSMKGADHFPARGNDDLLLQRSQIGELLMHFRNFERDHKRGLVNFGDPDWKEIKEAYFFYKDGVSLPPQEYGQEVLRIGNKFAPIRLADSNISLRPETNAFLAEHFSFPDTHGNDDVIAACTQKMELLFQKEARRSDK